MDVCASRTPAASADRGSAAASIIPASDSASASPTPPLLVRPEPKTLADTGVPEPMLLDLLLKSMYESGLETVGQIANFIKLPPFIIEALLGSAGARGLVQKLGTMDLRLSGNFIYGLTERGGAAARDALDRNRYVGPAPVTLDQFRAQVSHQSVRLVSVTPQEIERALDGLVLSRPFVRKIGPAISGARAILLYGPPGNGKTSIGSRLGRVIPGDILVPFSIVIDGQIIRIFDPTVHVASDAGDCGSADKTLKRDETDKRWVRCKRPFVVVGGELTLDMLDLSFSSFSKFYDAPMHIKALNGILMVDDLGRQLVSPTQLLNRWIVPMENRVDYLRLHTGKSFEVPFDAILIFSTNLEPTEIMDPAFLRRLPYKLEVPAPSRAEFENLLRALAGKHRLPISDDDVAFTLTAIGGRDLPLASFQPGFIVDQMIATCRFEGNAPVFSRELILQAVTNL